MVNKPLESSSIRMRIEHGKTPRPSTTSAVQGANTALAAGTLRRLNGGTQHRSLPNLAVLPSHPFRATVPAAFKPQTSSLSSEAQQLTMPVGRPKTAPAAFNRQTSSLSCGAKQQGLLVGRPNSVRDFFAKFEPKKPAGISRTPFDLPALEAERRIAGFPQRLVEECQIICDDAGSGRRLELKDMELRHMYLLLCRVFDVTHIDRPIVEEALEALRNDTDDDADFKNFASWYLANAFRKLSSRKQEPLGTNVQRRPGKKTGGSTKCQKELGGKSMR